MNDNELPPTTSNDNEYTPLRGDPVTPQWVAATRRILHETQEALARLNNPDRRSLLSIAVNLYVFAIIPDMLDELERLQKQTPIIASMREIVQAVADSDIDLFCYNENLNSYECPLCDGGTDAIATSVHGPDCLVTKAHTLLEGNN